MEGDAVNNETGQESMMNYFRDKTVNNPLRGGSVIMKGNLGEDLVNNGLTDNHESLACLAMAYSASQFPKSTITKSFAKMEEIVITAKFPRNYETNNEPDSKETPRGAGSKNGAAPTFLSSRADPNDYGDYNMSNIGDCPDPESVTMFAICVLAMMDWKGHLFNLAGSGETNALTAKQIKAYFAWFKTPNIEGEIIAKFMPKITGGMSSITADKELRAMLSKGKWMTYRLTFSTGGLLLAKMIRECPEDYLGVFSENTIDAIQAYETDNWSEEKYRVIPDKALGILYAYLKETEQLPDNLWGPKKHYDALMVQEKLSLATWFKEAKSKLHVYKSVMGTVVISKMPKGVFDV